MRYVKRKNRGRGSALKNRFVIGAKLSEHKFLRILRGYAEGVTMQELARTTHVTERTIRDTYASLRAGLRDAAIAHPERFGMAGTLLFDRSGRATGAGEQFLGAVQSSYLFRHHNRRHAPRLRCPEQENVLAFEVAARILCCIDMRHLTSATAQRMAMHMLSEAITSLAPRKTFSELSHYVPGARPMLHGNTRLYEDFRHHLLENPLGQTKKPGS